MSQATSGSSHTTGRTRFRSPGIPDKCWCGEGITEKISKLDPNPYRRYYRCVYAAERKLMNDNHVFKWVDEAFTDEIKQLDYQVGVLEEEVLLLKTTLNIQGPNNGKKLMILLCFLIPIMMVVLGIWMYNV